MTTELTAYDELSNDFDDSSGPEDYWTGCLEGTAFEHVTTVVLDERRWYNIKLDVYRRRSDSGLAGVRWNAPATEIQEGQDRNASVVRVESFTTTSYRVQA